MGKTKSFLDILVTGDENRNFFNKPKPKEGVGYSNSKTQSFPEEVHALFFGDAAVVL